MQHESRAIGVEVDSRLIESDAVVIAMGPWSILAALWLPLPAVFSLKGHSLIFDTGANIPAEALFLEYRERSGAMLAPELFPRTDGTTYVCAISSEEPLAADPARVVPDPGAIKRLEAMSSTISPGLASAKIMTRQACYRPVTRDGLPLIGPVPGVAGHIVEIAERNAIYATPLHPYTKALPSAVPIPDPVIDTQRERIPLTGEVPSPLNPPRGCVFHPRCWMATAECREAMLELREVQTGHWTACIHAAGYGSPRSVQS